MKKISVQSLNAVFNLVEELSSTVIWIRDITATKQIFISDNYQKIWGRSVTELYNNPSSFSDSLYVENNCSRQRNREGLNLYRINTSVTGVQHVRDHHFLLTDQQGDSVGLMGFALVVPEQEWLTMLENLHRRSSPQAVNFQNIVEIAQRELKLTPTCSQEIQQRSLAVYDLIERYCLRHKIMLTPREKLCLCYLLNGNVPKQIAASMNISSRTIEFHLENIRNKCRCKTTVQLISQINALVH